MKNTYSILIVRPGGNKQLKVIKHNYRIIGIKMNVKEIQVGCEEVDVGFIWLRLKSNSELL
jgi:hypothetical protein